MSKYSRYPTQPVPSPPAVDSLLDRMEVGNEYGSIVGLVPKAVDLVPELRRALSEIEAVRGRPCICYLANVVRSGPETSVHDSDQLPFHEMVGLVPAESRSVDVLLSTPGGSGEQVTRFVECLRNRFDNVEFIIPSKAMSAGTLWALSGDRIWMDERACLGPIDPQIMTKDGLFVPAQALFTLLKRLQDQGQEAISKGRNPDWTDITLVREMDQKQLASTISSSKWVETTAARYLEQYKFSNWPTHRSTGVSVTPADRQERAEKVASLLASHDRWKAHGHAISRDVAHKELQIEIDHPESIDGFLPAIRRTWALFHYVFDRGLATKLILSQHYVLARQSPPAKQG